MIEGCTVRMLGSRCFCDWARIKQLIGPFVLVIPAKAGTHEGRALEVAQTCKLPDSEAMGPRFRGDDIGKGVHNCHHTATQSSSAVRADNASAPSAVTTTGSPHMR